MMTAINGALREKLLRRRRQMHSEFEAEFRNYVSEAKKALPREANSPLFIPILRLLWGRQRGDLPPGWEEALPYVYRDFVEQHGWLLNHTKVEGAAPDAGIESLARLLCGMRRRQRQLQGGEAA